MTVTLGLPGADRAQPAGSDSGRRLRLNLSRRWPQRPPRLALTALSQPCGFTADGRPIGLQVIGPRHADGLVLRVGRAHEAATDWHTRRPELIQAAG